MRFYEGAGVVRAEKTGFVARRSIRKGRPYLKSFEYPGGEITLAIPADWIEEQEDDEVWMYYQDIPQAGTLRIRVNTYRGSKPVNAEVVAGMLQRMAGQIVPEKEHTVVPLPNGNQLVQFLQSFLEDDPPIIMVSWHVGIAVPPRYIQIASFNYTVSVEDAGSSVAIEEMKLLEGYVREANYSVSIEDEE